MTPINITHVATQHPVDRMSSPDKHHLEGLQESTTKRRKTSSVGSDVDSEKRVYMGNNETPSVGDEEFKTEVSSRSFLIQDLLQASMSEFRFFFKTYLCLAPMT